MSLIKLVALDMDGTTLNDNHITVSRKNRAAISQAIGQGVAVVPATGRSLAELPSSVRRIPGVRYAITSNGASVTDLQSGEALYENLIDSETAAEIFETAERFSAYAELYYQGRAFMQRDSIPGLLRAFHPLKLCYFLSLRKQVKNLADFVRRAANPVEKIEILPFSREEQGKLLATLRDLPVSITTSGMNSVEITNRGANKGTALAFLCGLLQIEPGETMAVGDNGNDREMLERAGISVAVENADEEIKRLAGYVTRPNVQSGVAAALHRFVLNTTAGDEKSLAETTRRK